MRSAFLAIVLAAVLAGGPTLVTVRGRVRSQSCLGPCCCTIIQGSYQGVVYGARFCRWFSPFPIGQVIEVTGRPDAHHFIW